MSKHTPHANDSQNPIVCESNFTASITQRTSSVVHVSVYQKLNWCGPWYSGTVMFIGKGIPDKPELCSRNNFKIHLKADRLQIVTLNRSLPTSWDDTK